MNVLLATTALAAWKETRDVAFRLEHWARLQLATIGPEAERLDLVGILSLVRRWIGQAGTP